MRVKLYVDAVVLGEAPQARQYFSGNSWAAERLIDGNLGQLCVQRTADSCLGPLIAIN
jgi:hypothetical protein